MEPFRLMLTKDFINHLTHNKVQVEEMAKNDLILESRCFWYPDGSLEITWHELSYLFLTKLRNVCGSFDIGVAPWLSSQHLNLLTRELRHHGTVS